MRLVSREPLGDLLVLLHDADRLVASFTGEFRDWARPAPSNTLILDADQVPEYRLQWQGAGPLPQADERHRKVWFQQPDRLRVEVFRGGRVVRIGVRDDRDWWRWDLRQGTDRGTAPASDGQLTLPPLLDLAILFPARLVAMLRLEPAGAGVRLGREVLRARAHPRLPAAGKARVSVELEVDAEYGTLLRWAVFEDGNCVHVTEAVEARFGEAIAGDRFVLTVPADGEPH